MGDYLGGWGSFCAGPDLKVTSLSIRSAAPPAWASGLSVNAIVRRSWAELSLSDPLRAAGR